MILVEATSWPIFSTPALHPISVRQQSCQRLSEFFLAAQRRTASAVKKKLPKGNPSKGFSLDSFPNRGARPLWHPGLPGTAGCTNRACLRTFEHSVVEGYDKLGTPDSAQSKFPLEISLRGGFHFCDEGPVPHRSPPRKDFCRAKMPCGGRDAKLAARQLDSQIPYQSSKACQTTTRGLTVFVSILD